MEKKVKIETKKLNQYVLRELGFRIWIIIIPFFIITIPAIILEKYYEFSIVTLVFVIATGVIFLLKKEYSKTFYYHITDSSIEFNTDLSKVNILLELIIAFVLARNKARHGSTENTLIKFENIKSINIKPKEIIVISKNNSSLTNNGKIRISKEIENYLEIKSVFENLKIR